VRLQRLPGELTEDCFDGVDARRDDTGLRGRGGGTERARKSGSCGRVRKARGPGGDARAPADAGLSRDQIRVGVIAVILPLVPEHDAPTFGHLAARTILDRHFKTILNRHFRVRTPDFRPDFAPPIGSKIGWVNRFSPILELIRTVPGPRVNISTRTSK